MEYRLGQPRQRQTAVDQWADEAEGAAVNQESAGQIEAQAGRAPDRKDPALRRTEHPDRVEGNIPAACESCGSSLSDPAATGTPTAHQVFDVPEPRPLEVTEHRASDNPAFRRKLPDREIIDPAVKRETASAFAPRNYI